MRSCREGIISRMSILHKVPMAGKVWRWQWEEDKVIRMRDCPVNGHVINPEREELQLASYNGREL